LPAAGFDWPTAPALELLLNRPHRQQLMDLVLLDRAVISLLVGLQGVRIGAVGTDHGAVVAGHQVLLRVAIHRLGASTAAWLADSAAATLAS
jgi:hypothetical protein